MSDFIKGEYKIRVDGTYTGRGPVIYVPNYWDDGEEWEFCEFESTEVRDSLARNPKAKWKKTENHDLIMATAALFAAAPKLLESLTGIMEALERREVVAYRNNHLDPQTTEYLIGEIAAVIKLATDTSAPVEKMIGGQPEAEVESRRQSGKRQ